MLSWDWICCLSIAGMSKWRLRCHARPKIAASASGLYCLGAALNPACSRQDFI